MLLSCFVLAALASVCLAEPPGYQTYDQVVNQLKKHASDHPKRTYLYSIGKSVQGRDLWVMAIANSQPDTHVVLRPEVSFTGCTHGNELSISEVLMRFINELLNNPSNDVRITEILDTTRVHVLVRLNADTGSQVTSDNCTSIVGSNNTNNYDLNQNYPDRFFCQRDPIQPETLAVIEWLESQRFLLGARFFTGGIVTTYPYENWRGSEFSDKPRETPTEDDDVFRYLAKKYSTNHKVMPLAATTNCDGLKWPDGIVNGAAWWPPIRGGTDIKYWRYGCYEITMEIGCCLTPPASELPKIWEDNRDALIEWTRAAQTGVRGVVTYKNGKPARYVSVQFNQREPMFKTDVTGEYYAVLLPGIYNMTLRFNCDAVFTAMIRVHTNSPLLLYNITLDDSLYFRSFYYNLDKYALTCTKSKRPVDCSLGYERLSDPNGGINRAQPTPYVLVALLILAGFVGF